jgi:hypothetical protein
MRNFVRMALPAALLFAVPLHAQTTIGVKGGLNVSDISTNIPDIEDIKESKTGFVGGGYVNLPLGSTFALQPEVLYSQEGFKGTEPDLTGVEAQFKVDYFQIPVLVKAQFPSGTIRPAVYAGPVVSFESSCKLGLSAGGTSAEYDCDSPEADVGDRSKTDFGGAFGANLDWFVGPVIVTIDARYLLGFTNVNSDDTAPDESVKNRVWQFMAGVGFPLN